MAHAVEQQIKPDCGYTTVCINEGWHIDASQCQTNSHPRQLLPIKANIKNIFESIFSVINKPFAVQLPEIAWHIAHWHMHKFDIIRNVFIIRICSQSRALYTSNILAELCGLMLLHSSCRQLGRPRRELECLARLNSVGRAREHDQNDRWFDGCVFGQNCAKCAATDERSHKWWMHYITLKTDSLTLHVLFHFGRMS